MRLPGRAIQCVVVAVEPADALLLAVEGLDDHMPAEGLLHMAVHVAQIILLLAEEFLRLTDDDHHNGHRQGDDEQRDQGHLPGNGDHHDKHADHGHQRGDDLCQALIQGATDSINVVGKQRENLSMWRSVEIAERHAVDLLHDLPPQLIGDLDGDIGHQPALDVAESRR